MSVSNRLFAKKIGGWVGLKLPYKQSFCECTEFHYHFHHDHSSTCASLCPFCGDPTELRVQVNNQTDLSIVSAFKLQSFFTACFLRTNFQCFIWTTSKSLFKSSVTLWFSLSGCRSIVFAWSAQVSSMQASSVNFEWFNKRVSQSEQCRVNNQTELPIFPSAPRPLLLWKCTMSIAWHAQHY